MRFAVSHGLSSLLFLALSTAALAAPVTSRATAPLSFAELGTADLPAFLAGVKPAGMKSATTCGFTCIQVVRACRTNCMAAPGSFCGPVGDCTDPCTYICQCLDAYGEPCGP